ncbi:hypothetical protein [Streptomyces sp. NPDC006552]|uniref:DUF6197 family protein n=1 Tax=Streptomyces sp. NPDC006552 TaxID=3157179 RepID=UPI0033A85BE1
MHAPTPIPATSAAPTSPPRAAAATPAAPLSLEERLALINTAMTARLDEAAVAYEVNTAHIDTGPLALADVVTVPLTPHLTPDPARTRVAGLLYRAYQLLQTDGWCTGTLTDTDGARCILGALRAASRGDRGLEQTAADIVLGAIRAEFGDDVDTIPAFNDAWASAHTPLRLVDVAARRADVRGL